MGVEVTDIVTNTSTIYHAIRVAARVLSIDKRYIEHYIFFSKKCNDKPVLGRYIFKLLNSDVTPPQAVKVQKTSIRVEVTKVETKQITIYPSIGAAARALG